MNQKGHILLFIILIIATLGGYLIYQKQTPLRQSSTGQAKPTPILQSSPTSAASPAPTGSASTSISIQSLNEGIKLKKFSSQNYNIEGYVINKNTCSCSKEVYCLSCLPEILVSEDKQNTAEDSRKIYIRVDNIEDFQIGKKYRFSILLPSDKDKQGFSYERRLIKYELIR